MTGSVFCCPQCGRLALGDNHVCLEDARRAYGPADEEHEHIGDDWTKLEAKLEAGIRAAFPGGSVHFVGPLEAEPVRSTTDRALEAANDQIEKLLADLETCRVQRDAASAVAEIAAQLAAVAVFSAPAATTAAIFVRRSRFDALSQALELYRAVTL